MSLQCLAIWSSFSRFCHELSLQNDFSSTSSGQEKATNCSNRNLNKRSLTRQSPGRKSLQEILDKQLSIRNFLLEKCSSTREKFPQKEDLSKRRSRASLLVTSKWYHPRGSLLQKNANQSKRRGIFIPHFRERSVRFGMPASYCQ